MNFPVEVIKRGRVKTERFYQMTIRIERKFEDKTDSLAMKVKKSQHIRFKYIVLKR